MKSFINIFFIVCVIRFGQCTYIKKTYLQHMLGEMKFNGYPSGRAPFIVSIQKYLVGVSQYHYCTGTIVTKFDILTLDQCVINLQKYSEILIHAGIQDTHTSQSNLQVRSAAKILRYDENSIVENSYNDIALIRLSTPLIFNNAIQPINFDFLMSQWKSFPQGGLQFGWDTAILRGVLPLRYASTIHVKSKDFTKLCEPIIEKFDFGDNLCYVSDQCSNGGHGSPLIVYNENFVAHIFGIWSYDLCFNSTAYSVYTPIAKYVDWIQTNLYY